MRNFVQPPTDFEFTPVDLDEFYSGDEMQHLKRGASTAIVVFTEKEQKIVNIMYDRLKSVAPDVLVVLADRIADLERLTANIGHFPSLLQTQVIDREVRNQHTLVDSLLSDHNGDRLLHLPSKAILGKGFLVAKFHSFCSMAHIAADWDFPEDFVSEVRTASLAVMFTIMAEDVYLSLIENKNISVAVREKIASELILLWEHRSDENVIQMAPILEKLWEARRKLAPAFGTMVGTSELLLFSMEMDDDWYTFISTQLSKNDVTQAMEELLFGASYEEILRLKNIINEQKGGAISCDEAALILGKSSNDFIFSDKDDLFEPRNFYALYSVRRDNARARARFNLKGPHFTLEDYYMKFILEKNYKESNDG